jgi:hypothetical protein
MTSTRTVDFIGTTYSIRFGVAEGDVVTSNPVFLGTVKLDDELVESTALPSMRALMKLGAVFKVYRGCPMLRAENVPRQGPADEHLRSVACEFASDEMRIVVQNALFGRRCHRRRHRRQTPPQTMPQQTPPQTQLPPLVNGMMRLCAHARAHSAQL